MDIKIDQDIFKSFPKLETERLFLREILLKDSTDLYEIRSNEEVMRFMDTYKMTSIGDAEKLIHSVKESFINKSGINWAMVEKTSNRFVGYCGFWRIIPEHCRTEIGYALSPQYWGKGYMLEALNTIIHYGFTQIKFHSIEANVNPDNKNSIHLLERIGFKKEAYFRENFLFNNKFLDSMIYSLLEKDFSFSR